MFSKQVHEAVQNGWPWGETKSCEHVYSIVFTSHFILSISHVCLAFRRLQLSREPRRRPWQLLCELVALVTLIFGYFITSTWHGPYQKPSQYYTAVMSTDGKFDTLHIHYSRKYNTVLGIACAQDSLRVSVVWPQGYIIELNSFVHDSSKASCRPFTIFSL